MEKSVGKTNRTSNASSSRKTIDSPNFANLTVAQPPGNLASNETNASAAAEETVFKCRIHHLSYKIPSFSTPANAESKCIMANNHHLNTKFIILV